MFMLGQSLIFKVTDKSRLKIYAKLTITVSKTRQMLQIVFKKKLKEKSIFVSCLHKTNMTPDKYYHGNRTSI